jgi:hypothetical protein
MGSGYSQCSHKTFTITDIDQTIYDDKFDIWKFQMADGICDSCQKEIRLIKKTCREHNIPQPWEYFDQSYCPHDVIMIRRKTRNQSTNRYMARAECVGCLTNIPVYITFKIDTINGEEVDIQTMEWEVDKQKLQQEMKDKQK